MRGDYRWCWSVSPQAVMEPAKRIRKTVFIGGPDHSFVECLYGRLAGGGVACPCYQRYNDALIGGKYHSFLDIKILLEEAYNNPVYLRLSLELAEPGSTMPFMVLSAQ
ncbi:unnamed protein product [Penicillium roqueforti FM164]|uniref:Genomic scaffold, ProqFM164S03 n=1 Tax=Penicillium roqueforti (strain FM164) TaxID=1365484 RepID=W6QGS8_PENRF|nr:unnamed protein product [Penicillium roqueforti FM164]